VEAVGSFQLQVFRTYSFQPDQKLASGHDYLSGFLFERQLASVTPFLELL
jgi:hypothetical protein